MLHKKCDHTSSLSAVRTVALARGVDDVALLIEIAQACRVTGLSAPFLAWFILWSMRRDDARTRVEVAARLDRSQRVR